MYVPMYVCMYYVCVYIYIDINTFDHVKGSQCTIIYYYLQSRSYLLLYLLYKFDVICARLRWPTGLIGEQSDE